MEKHNTLDDCWYYAGIINNYGYGMIQVGMKQQSAHRVVYENMVGEIPEGKQIDHMCRTRCCINPAHVEIVTSKENTLRGYGPTAINARKDVCIRGHAYTPENMLRNKYGWRQCKACRRIRYAEKVRSTK